MAQCLEIWITISKVVRLLPLIDCYETLISNTALALYGLERNLASKLVLVKGVS